MKYFLNMYESFMNFWGKLAKVLIINSYMNKKTCEIPEDTIVRKISHVGD